MAVSAGRDVRQSSLLFAGLKLSRPDYVLLWKKLPADSAVDDVTRNFFIRQPTLLDKRLSGLRAVIL